VEEANYAQTNVVLGLPEYLEVKTLKVFFVPFESSLYTCSRAQGIIESKPESQ